MLELLSQLVEIETINNPSEEKKPSKECPSFIRDRLADWGNRERDN